MEKEETLEVDLQLDGKTKNYVKGRKKINFGEFMITVYKSKESNRNIDQIIINLEE